MNKKLLVLFAMMLTAVSSVATDEDPISTLTLPLISLDEEVLDSSASSSEDVLDVGDLEYEDEDWSSEDGVGRHLRAYNGRTGGGRRWGRKPGGHVPVIKIPPPTPEPFPDPYVYDYPTWDEPDSDTVLSDMAYLAIGVVVLVLIVVVVVCVCCKCKKRKQKNNESIEGDEEEGR